MSINPDNHPERLRFPTCIEEMQFMVSDPSQPEPVNTIFRLFRHHYESPELGGIAVTKLYVGQREGVPAAVEVFKREEEFHEASTNVLGLVYEAEKSPITYEVGAQAVQKVRIAFRAFRREFSKWCLENCPNGYSTDSSIWLNSDDDKDEKEEPPELNGQVLKAQSYPIIASQEVKSLIQWLCDITLGRNIIIDADMVRHHFPGAPFGVSIGITDAEKNQGYSIDLIVKKAAEELGLDAAFIVFYISQLLAPAGKLPANTAATAIIDLDDVARKTMGGYAGTPADIEKRRAKVWGVIRWISRVTVEGERTTVYEVKQTGEKIPTKISTTPWLIMSKEEPQQAALFPEITTPVRVELVASRAWTRLTAHHETAQYLEIGELLGSIPPAKAGGAWARAAGTAFSFWARTYLADAKRGDEVPLTRRELLNQYPVLVAHYSEYLTDGGMSKNVDRLYKYWHGAADILEDLGVIERPKKPDSKDPKKLDVIKEPKPKGRAQWEKWLDSRPGWTAGTKTMPALEAAANGRLYEQKPRQLNPAKRVQRRPGRPRKKVQPA